MLSREVAFSLGFGRGGGVDCGIAPFPMVSIVPSSALPSRSCA